MEFLPIDKFYLHTINGDYERIWIKFNERSGGMPMVQNYVFMAYPNMPIAVEGVVCNLRNEEETKLRIQGVMDNPAFKYWAFDCPEPVGRDWLEQVSVDRRFNDVLLPTVNRVFS